MPGDTMVKCPQCDRPATEAVVERDGRCSRCTQEAKERRLAIRAIAVRIAEADARGGNLPAAENVVSRAGRYVRIAEEIMKKTEER